MDFGLEKTAGQFFDYRQIRMHGFHFAYIVNKLSEMRLNTMCLVDSFEFEIGLPIGLSFQKTQILNRIGSLISSRPCRSFHKQRKYVPDSRNHYVENSDSVNFESVLRSIDLPFDLQKI